MVQFEGWGHFLNSDKYFLGYTVESDGVPTPFRATHLQDGDHVASPERPLSAFVPPLPVENVQCDLPL